MHLHEEGALCEDGGKRDEGRCSEGEAAELVGVCSAKNAADVVTPEKILHFLGKLFLRLVDLCYTIHGMSLHWMFLLVLKLYQIDVAHAILLSGKIDFSRLTADYLSAKFKLYVIRCIVFNRYFVYLLEESLLSISFTNHFSAFAIYPSFFLSFIKNNANSAYFWT